MLLINMPIPANCVDCPCSHWVEGGKWEGMLMCSATESKKLHELGETLRDRDITAECLKDEHLQKRPEGCPILCEISGFVTKGG